MAANVQQNVPQPANPIPPFADVIGQPDHSAGVVVGEERRRAALRDDQRRRDALQKIDQAQFSWSHVKACAVVGFGFFTDAYSIFAIDIATNMLGFVYGDHDNASINRNLDPRHSFGLKIATPIGTLFGQLVFGWLADRVGRKTMYGVELMIIIIGTFAQALSGPSHAVSIIGALIVWRFVMGVGIGGDYPLSAVMTSEFAATRIRGRMMTAVFAMQGLGYFTAAMVAFIVTEGYKSNIINGPSTLDDIDYCWRLLIGCGAVFGTIALYFRTTISETPRYTMDVERNVRQAVQDVDAFLTTGTYIVDPDAPVERVRAPKATWSNFIHYFGQWRNGKILLGTAYSWFALDIAYYGLILNNTNVIKAIGFGNRITDVHRVRAYTTLRNVSIGNLIIISAGLIPGSIVALCFIDRWGRKPIQMIGFAFSTVIFVCMGFGYNSMVNTTPTAGRTFVFLYCLANFFMNFGPNTTTFIVPGEAFPTRYRSTAHGISAASGKLGAIVAQIVFAYLKDIGGPDAFIRHILEIFGFFMLTGLGATFLIEETNGRTLEDLSNESQDGFITAEPLD